RLDEEGQGGEGQIAPVLPLARTRGDALPHVAMQSSLIVSDVTEDRVVVVEGGKMPPPLAFRGTGELALLEDGHQRLEEPRVEAPAFFRDPHPLLLAAVS